MRKIILLPIIVFSLFLGFEILAQNAEFRLPKPGILPDSPLYFLDRLGEFLQEFFTFSSEAKARLEITFAAERIAEIKVLLEKKGVEAKGLDVAQSRLQAHLAKATMILNKEKTKGKDVTNLAKELDESFEGLKSTLAQTFKEQKRTLEAKAKELKAQLKDAHRAGDVAREEAVTAELGQVKRQLELLELREEDIEKELEAEEEKIEEGMEAKTKAEKAILEVEKELKEFQKEAAEEGIEIPAEALVKFNTLFSQAKAAFEANIFQEARDLAKKAEESLEEVEKEIEQLKEKTEEKEEVKEEIQELEKELEEILAKAKEKGLVISSEALGEFNSLISQAKAALDAENYKDAKKLVEQAEKVIEKLEKEKEKEKKKFEEEEKEEEEKLKETEE